MSSLPTSYEPDRLIKCGWQQIRTKHKSWRRQWIVLRGHTITYYKDEREYKPQEIISLSYASASIIAVTDLNQNNDNYSGKVRWAIFTPSQNRYFRANDLITAKEWVAAVKSVCNSFANNHPSKGTQPSLSQAGWHENNGNQPIPTGPLRPIDLNCVPKVDNSAIISHEDEFPEEDDYEDDDYDYVLEPPVPPLNSALSALALSSTATLPEEGMTSFSERDGENGSPVESTHPDDLAPIPGTSLSVENTNSMIGDEKIIYSGNLIRHRKRYGQRRWKRVFVVLTENHLYFFKPHSNSTSNELETPIKAIPLNDVIDVLEIDALSKSKLYCMQIITHAKVRRFSAPSEDALTQWLVSCKAALAKTRGD